MDYPDQFKWTIIYTDHQKKFIHLKHLQKSNPQAQIICADISNPYTKKFSWRNSDNLIRNWLKTNILNIKHTNIAILEWDVLVSQSLPNIKINGLMCKRYIRRTNLAKNWYWFKEIPLLDKYANCACGVAPLSVLFMDFNTVLTWLSVEFDDIYKKDIFCELRLPSILSSKQIPIMNYAMPNVFWDKCYYSNKQSIYHPVKYDI